MGSIIGVVAWLWLKTLRVDVRRARTLSRQRSLAGPSHPSDPDAKLSERFADHDDVGARPWVLCFHHGRQFPLLAWPRRRRTAVLVSHSRDGSLQTRALRTCGLEVVRGSSSRGGARGLAGIVRLLRCGYDAAFAVDGPRGPHGVVKEGAIVAARSANGLLVPMGSAARRQHVLARAWDRFAIALPFTRVTVVLGEPIDPNAEDACALLQAAIERANEEAETCVASS